MIVFMKTTFHSESKTLFHENNGNQCLCQIFPECVNVCLRKLSFTREQAYAFARTLMNRTEVMSVDESTIDQAAALAIRYQLSHWDALIVAAALLAGCDTFV